MEPLKHAADDKANRKRIRAEMKRGRRAPGVTALAGDYPPIVTAAEGAPESFVRYIENHKEIQEMAIKSVLGVQKSILTATIGEPPVPLGKVEMEYAMERIAFDGPGLTGSEEASCPAIFQPPDPANDPSEAMCSVRPGTAVVDVEAMPPDSLLIDENAEYTELARLREECAALRARLAQPLPPAFEAEISKLP